MENHRLLPAETENRRQGREETLHLPAHKIVAAPGRPKAEGRAGYLVWFEQSSLKIIDILLL